jgi:hypothetical protein
MPTKGTRILDKLREPQFFLFLAFRLAPYVLKWNPLAEVRPFLGKLHEIVEGVAFTQG